MTTASASSDQPLSGSACLTEAVEAANTLLYHAVSNGQDLPGTIRDPIITARAALKRGDALGNDDEGRFLDAYAKLAQRVAPVTAVTLEATSRRERRGRLGQLLGLRPVSDAQGLAGHFGLLALCLIGAIAAGEWTHAFIGSISAAEKQFSANSQLMREAEIRRGSLVDQIEMLGRSGDRVVGAASTSAVREALKARKDEVDAKIWALDYINSELRGTVDKGYETLERMLFLGRERLKYVSLPLGNILGSFLLPVLYGALGTCAFVMRSLFREMVDRTFDARRTGEFTVRIFLGMLSGLTLQWLVVRSDGTVAGGVTPAVLAFLGGYSVEMLFAAMDRLVQLVAGRMRAPHRSQAAPRPRLERAAGAGARRTRERDAAANGTAPRPRTSAALPAFATVRNESR